MTGATNDGAGGTNQTFLVETRDQWNTYGKTARGASSPYNKSALGLSQIITGTVPATGGEQER